MQLSYNLLLFAITFLGGSIPIWIKPIQEDKMHYLLAFSGSFLLSITFLHLLPEGFTELGSKAGIYVLAGFFLQLVIQRLTHGVEHGHSPSVHGDSNGHHHHTHNHDHHNHYHVMLAPVLLGLTVHATMEGFPLGFKYTDANTILSLYLAVAAHKLPEAMIATTLVLNTKSKGKAVIFLILFSLVTPITSIAARLLSTEFDIMQQFVTMLLPIVAGAFIHIATTIFFESGTRQHKLTWPKTLAIISGLCLALMTLMFE